MKPQADKICTHSEQAKPVLCFKVGACSVGLSQAKCVSQSGLLAHTVYTAVGETQLKTRCSCLLGGVTSFSIDYAGYRVYCLLNMRTYTLTWLSYG